MGKVNKNKYMRERYAALKGSGVCTSCGKVDARPGKALCPVCFRRNQKHTRRWQKRQYKAHAALKICVVCHAAVPMPGTKWCGACSEKGTEKAARRSEKLYADGKCTRCGKTNDRTPLKTCTQCYMDRKSNGMETSNPSSNPKRKRAKQNALGRAKTVKGNARISGDRCQEQNDGAAHQGDRKTQG